MLQADARKIPLRDGCCQMVVTSPPYWGLRDYGTGKWVGGSSTCNHDAGYQKGREDYGINDYPSIGYERKVKGAGFGTRHNCVCGAVWQDSAIGLEQSLEQYLLEIVAVFGEVKRVLRPDGLLFVNLGDTYSNSGRGSGGVRTYSNKQATNKGSLTLNRTPEINGIGGHQLLGIPWRVAFALQQDGWYLRSDIIWHKPNPMPEALVVKRCTVAHEYLFMFSKSGMDYYWDGKAIEEDVVPDRHSLGRGYKRTKGKSYVDQAGREVSLDDPWEGNKIMPAGYGIRGNQSWGQYTIGAGYGPDRRNRRDVWSITVEHSPESHFATFPQALVLPCILAGSRAGDLVYDPFGGTSTVGYVAERLGRRWVTTELSWSYCQAARRRTAQLGLFQ